MLRLWALCGKPACRRARACRRDPQSCFGRLAPLLPEQAAIAVAAMAEGKRGGLGYDEVRRLGPAEMAVFEEWVARLAHIARPARTHAPAGEAPPAPLT